MKLRHSMALGGALALIAALANPTSALQEAVFGDTRAAKYPIPNGTWIWAPSDQVTDMVAADPMSSFGRSTFLPSTMSKRLTSTTDADRRALADVLTSPGTDCWFTGGYPSHDSDDFTAGPDPTTFDEVAAGARAIIEGVVTGIDGGYYGGSYGGPGLLVQVEVRRWHKRESDYPEEKVVHYFHPQGDFRLGEAKICRRSDNWPDPPGIGAQVLLFPRLLPTDSRIVRLRGSGGQVAFEARTGLGTTEHLAQFPEFRVVKFAALRRLVRARLNR